ncbi:hypothetical protein FRC11_006362, partial [Ceratobasidium sp. 423]
VGNDADDADAGYVELGGDAGADGKMDGRVKFIEDSDDGSLCLALARSLGDGDGSPLPETTEEEADADATRRCAVGLGASNGDDRVGDAARRGRVSGARTGDLFRFPAGADGGWVRLDGIDLDTLLASGGVGKLTTDRVIRVPGVVRLDGSGDAILGPVRSKGDIALFDGGPTGVVGRPNGDLDGVPRAETGRSRAPRPTVLEAGVFLPLAFGPVGLAGVFKTGVEVEVSLALGRTGVGREIQAEIVQEFESTMVQLLQ